MHPDKTHTPTSALTTTVTCLQAMSTSLSIPDLDCHRKLAATVGHPLHCMPAPWPGHATLGSEWFDTQHKRAHTHTHTQARLDTKPFFKSSTFSRSHSDCCSQSHQGHTLFLTLSPRCSLYFTFFTHRLAFLFSVLSGGRLLYLIYARAVCERIKYSCNTLGFFSPIDLPSQATYNGNTVRTECVTLV